MKILKSKLIHTSIIIPYHIVDYYTNTIGDMQNEMYFFYHCNKFEYNHDYEKVTKYS